MTATQTAQAPAAYRRRSSTYVLAFHPHAGWTPEDTLADLIQVAADKGLLLAGSHVHAHRAVLVLRLTSDEHAAETAEALSAECQAPVDGIVTGLGVHRRQVQA